MAFHENNYSRLSHSSTFNKNTNGIRLSSTSFNSAQLTNLPLKKALSSCLSYMCRPVEQYHIPADQNLPDWIRREATILEQEASLCLKVIVIKVHSAFHRYEEVCNSFLVYTLLFNFVFDWCVPLLLFFAGIFTVNITAES